VEFCGWRAQSPDMDGADRFMWIGLWLTAAAIAVGVLAALVLG